jgi:DNA-binding SARP family transcriptional activator/tetratricopeptide (TPR) repeat protein
MMEFNILGPLELSGSGSHDIKLSPQLWCVVVSLLMAGGKPVPIDSLARHLRGWDTSPVADATIRTYVSRVNAVLAQDGVRIGRRAGGYELPVDPQAVDLHKFRSLKRQAESVAESGDPGHAAALLRQADELWRGPALMGLSGQWASAVSQALDEERHEAVKLRIGIELDRGRQASVLGELRELSERYPFDEEIARALMVTLYRLGRQKDAVQAGRDISERVTEAGLEPSPQLRDVHIQILRGDTGLGVTPAYRNSAQAGQPNTLLADNPDFVGRAEETELLTADCQANAPLLEVIEGAAGVGKTALALRVAHRMSARYPDAQLFLRFPGDGPRGVAEALDRLLRMLGVPAARIPAEPAERARLWRAEMAHRRAVIVLDDVPGPDQVTPIVLAAGDSLTIATSRHHADWPGQRTLRLQPLGTADSVTLLWQAANPAAEQDRAKMAEAAGLCGGWPLAIRVVASRLRERDGELDNLIDELRDVHAGRPDSGETGRRIFSAFEFAYRQLTPKNKRVFRMLGASPCKDFELDAAAALTGETRASVADTIVALSGHCLIEHTPAGRLRFHDLVRSYAAARCAQEEPGSERRRAISRLIDHYSDALSAAARADHESARRGVAGFPGTDHGGSPVQLSDPGSVHAWLQAEWRNILLTARHAASHEWHRQCADLTHSLAGFLQADGYWSDAIPAHELGLHACRLLGDPARCARAALDLSAAYRWTGDHEKAQRHADEALTGYLLLGDQLGQADALDQLGLICRHSGSARGALAHHQEAADLYRKVGDQQGMAKTVMHAATAFGTLGRYAEEACNLGRALRLFRQVGDRRGEAMCLNNLGAVLEDRGLHRDAVAHYEESITVFREIPERQNLALLDHNLGHVQHYKGNYDGAIAIYRKALTEYYAIGDLQHQALALADIGTAFGSKGCYSEALVHHQKSAGLAESISDRRQLAAALCGAGDAHRGLGSYGAATESYDRAHRMATEIEAPYLNGKALYGMAETVFITQGSAAAKIYWREAHDIFRQLGVPEAEIVELRLYGSGATAGSA